MGGDGAKGRDWRKTRGHHLCKKDTGASPVSYRHNFSS